MIFAIPSPKVDALVGVDDMALVLLASLAAMGITFTAADGIAATSEWIVDKFEAFVESAGDTLSNVWSNIRYGITSSGKFAVNAYGADRIGVFARQLVQDYSITSNSQISSNQPAMVSIGGYQIPIYIGRPSGRGMTTYNRMLPYSLPEGSFSFGDSGRAVFQYSSNFTGWHLVFSYGSSVLDRTGYSDYGKPFVWFVYFVDNTYYFGFFGASYQYTDVDGFYPKFEDQNASYWPAWQQFVNYCILPPVIDGIDINAGTLDLPQVGDYDDDDGILIDGIGSWGDTLQDIWDKISGWSIPDQPVPAITYEYAASDELAGELVNEGELTTENSPLILWPGGTFSYNFSFSSIWHYVTDWVSSMSAGLALTGSIMFSLPFVGVWYAVLVLIIVLSLWRLLKHA